MLLNVKMRRAGTGNQTQGKSFALMLISGVHFKTTLASQFSKRSIIISSKKKNTRGVSAARGVQEGLEEDTLLCSQHGASARCPAHGPTRNELGALCSVPGLARSTNLPRFGRELNVCLQERAENRSERISSPQRWPSCACPRWPCGQPLSPCSPPPRHCARHREESPKQAHCRAIPHVSEDYCQANTQMIFLGIFIFQ